MQLKSSIQNSPLLRILLMTALVVVYFATHVPRLGTDEINPDAVNWHWRAEQFVEAVKSGLLKETYRSYHPGVPLMILVGFPVEALKKVSGERGVYDRTTYQVPHFVAKFSVNVTILLLISLVVFSLSKVLGFKVAYVTGIFLTLDPFYLGNERLLHMDVLLSLLIVLGFTFLYRGLEGKSIKFIVFSAAFFGLAFWTKSVAILSTLYGIGLCALLFFARYLSLKKAALFSAIFVFSLILVGFAILPALWLDPVYVVKDIYQSGRNVVEEGHMETFFGQKTMNPGPLYYLVVLGFKLSPVAFIFFVVAVVAIVASLKKETRRKFINLSRKDAFFFVLFGYFLGHLLAITISQKKIDRYLIPLFPIIYIFASYYWIVAFRLIKPIFGRLLLVVFSVAVIVHPLVTIFPYYFFYNSPMFGGPKAAIWAVGQKSFGTGVFEVRDYAREHYGYLRLGLFDRKGIAAIYPSSMVLDVRVYGARQYDLLILDNDGYLLNKNKDMFVYDRSLYLAGIEMWSFYVKKTQ